MKITLRYHGKPGKIIETKHLTISMLLSELSINPETVIVRLNNEVVTPDIKLKPDDEIELISVVSGG